MLCTVCLLVFSHTDSPSLLLWFLGLDSRWNNLKDQILLLPQARPQKGTHASPAGCPRLNGQTNRSLVPRVPPAPCRVCCLPLCAPSTLLLLWPLCLAECGLHGQHTWARTVLATQVLATLLRSPRCARAASANLCLQSLRQRDRWELILILESLCQVSWFLQLQEVHAECSGNWCHKRMQMAGAGLARAVQQWPALCASEIPGPPQLRWHVPSAEL